MLYCFHLSGKEIHSQYSIWFRTNLSGIFFSLLCLKIELSTICQSQEHHEKFFCTEYEKSKAIADKIARQAALDGIPIILLYPGVIYGSGKLTAGNVLARMV